MTDFESQVLQQLSVLKMQMEQLLGNGQPAACVSWSSASNRTSAACSG